MNLGRLYRELNVQRLLFSRDQLVDWLVLAVQQERRATDGVVLSDWSGRITHT